MGIIARLACRSGKSSGHAAYISDDWLQAIRSLANPDKLSPGQVTLPAWRPRVPGSIAISAAAKTAIPGALDLSGAPAYAGTRRWLMLARPDDDGAPLARVEPTAAPSRGLKAGWRRTRPLDARFAAPELLVMFALSPRLRGGVVASRPRSGMTGHCCHRLRCPLPPGSPATRRSSRHPRRGGGGRRRSAWRGQVAEGPVT